MSDDAGFLAAMKAAPADDTPRLAYADWLDDRHELRAHYLRLQVELVRTWTYTAQNPGLYTLMEELASTLDPGWLAAVRRCTTPAPPVDVAKAVPALADQARTTVRLHPRPGESPSDASKLGGLFLWPEREPWPVASLRLWSANGTPAIVRKPRIRCPYLGAIRTDRGPRYFAAAIHGSAFHLRARKVHDWRLRRCLCVCLSSLPRLAGPSFDAVLLTMAVPNEALQQPAAAVSALLLAGVQQGPNVRKRVQAAYPEPAGWTRFYEDP
jgi:uncharacterized protein (TIGR02996 family)